MTTSSLMALADTDTSTLPSRGELAQSRALSDSARRKLPAEIQRALRGQLFSRILPIDAELFRYHPDCLVFTQDSKKRWQRVLTPNSSHLKQGQVFVPYRPLPELALTASAAPANPSILPPSPVAVTRARPIKQAVIQASASYPATVRLDRLPDNEVILQQGKFTSRKFVDHTFQAGETVFDVCERYTGLREKCSIYGFNYPFFTAIHPPQAGDIARVAAGWRVSLCGSASNGYSVKLSWRGSSQGEQTVALPEKLQPNEIASWQADLDLPPGDYTITAQNGPASSEIQLTVIGIKQVQFGVFFDGTSMNYFNDRACDTDKEEPGNVGKLYELYPQSDNRAIGRVYVRGVGTYAISKEADPDYCQALEEEKKNKKFSKMLEQALGLGIDERIEKALNELNTFLDIQSQAGSKLKCTVDVFGFSRGAATARIFVNKMHELIKEGDTNYWPAGSQFSIRCLGLFDTVGSIGIPGNEKNRDFNLHLNDNSCRHALHLVAEHEKRAFFPVTLLRGADGKLPSGMKEEVVPGTHTNVGGGIPQKAHQNRQKIASFVLWRDSNNAIMDAKAERKFTEKLQLVKDEYRSWGGNIVAERGRIDDNGAQWVNCFLERKIEPTLEHIYLEKMHTWACNLGVPLMPISELEEAEFPLRYQIDNALRESHQHKLPSLKENYIYLSHSPTGILLNPNKPERHPDTDRDQYQNKPTQAINS